MVALPITSTNEETHAKTPLIPLRNRITANAAVDGIYDLGQWEMYLTVGGRRREVHQRILKGTLARSKDGRISAYMFDENTNRLSFIYMSASQPLTLA